LICPPSHEAALGNRLTQQSQGYGLHLLILGYSCLDKTPLNLIQESGNVIKSLVIVNGDRAQGEAALTKLRDHLTHVAPYEYRDDYVEVFDGGFIDFARPAPLTALVERINAS
jgi:hypothetical protein